LFRLVISPPPENHQGNFQASSCNCQDVCEFIVERFFRCVEVIQTQVCSDPVIPVDKFFQCFKFPSTSFIFFEQSLHFTVRMWMCISAIYNLDTFLFAVFLTSVRYISIFVSFYFVKLCTMILESPEFCCFLSSAIL